MSSSSALYGHEVAVLAVAADHLRSPIEDLAGFHYVNRGRFGFLRNLGSFAGFRFVPGWGFAFEARGSSHTHSPTGMRGPVISRLRVAVPPCQRRCWGGAARAKQLSLEAVELVSEVLEDRQDFCELGAGGEKVARGRRDLDTGGPDFGGHADAP